jgi:ABC-type multidrug transport system permease subunit
MFVARTMEFVRDRGTFFWNLLFPFFLVFGLAFAFSGGGDKLFKVGTVGAAPGDLPFLSLEQAQFIPYGGPSARDAALRKLERHQIDMVLDFGAGEFAVNAESSKGRLLRTIFLSQQAAERSGLTFSEHAVSGRATRYVDWLVPGIIGMNMMFSSLFGVGYVIVRYRKNGVLKRFKATPVSALNFVSAQAASRLVIVLLTSIFVYAGTNAFLGFMMRGSYANLLLLTALGILCMISLGLVFASRLRSEEMAGGLLNVVTMPMLALSGVFFSLEGSPPVLRTVAQAFPLTHFTEAARKIMLDGAGLLDIAPHLIVLGGLTAVFLGISAALFKWE